LIDGLLEAPSSLVEDGTTHGLIFMIAHTFHGMLDAYYVESLGARIISPTRIFIEGQSVLEALELTKSLFEVLYDTLPKFGWFPLYEQLQFFRVTKSWPNKNFIKFAKYFTAYPMAFFLENELPEVPEGYLECTPGPLVFTGRIKRLLMNRLVHKNNSTVRIWWSVLQGVKRAAREAPESFILDSYLKHAKKLSKEPTSEVDLQLIPYIKRALKTFAFDKPKFYEASTSASFTNTRSHGGQREEVRDWLIEHFGMSYQDQVDLGKGHKVDLYGPAIPDFETVVKEASYFGERKLNVEVHGILEPLKVRLITKGESVPYWLSRTAQKDMWSYLQNFDIFLATGTPLTLEHIIDLRDKRDTFERKYNIHFDSWVSGDYSGATDGVDIRMTALVFEEMLKHSNYSEDFKNILRRVIYQQRLHYPEVTLKIPKKRKLKDKNHFKSIRYIEKKVQVPSVLQRNGQLMGSTLSFPILCIINLVAYWYALETYLGQQVELEDLPVRINGDDILFPSNPEMYTIWQEKIHKVGFDLSIGKNYIHSRYFTMNSMLFSENRTTGTVDQIPYFNPGLLTGKAKVTARDNVRVLPLWDWYEEVINGAKDKFRAHKRFVHYHKNLIERLTRNGKLNLFINRHLGGIGFPLDPEVRKHITFTSHQRKLAHYYMRSSLRRARSGIDPTKFILRLVKAETKTKSYTCIDLGFHDRLEYIPETSPLNINQSNETKRLYDLPLMSQRPTSFSKPLLTIKHGVRLPSSVKMSREPRLKTDKLFSFPYKLVSVHDMPVDYLLSDYSIEDSKFFDPEIGQQNSRYRSKGWYWIDFNTGHTHYQDIYNVSRDSMMKPHVVHV
jgi:hypothetical protein